MRGTDRDCWTVIRKCWPIFFYWVCVNYEWKLSMTRYPWQSDTQNERGEWEPQHHVLKGMKNGWTTLEQTLGYDQEAWEWKTSKTIPKVNLSKCTQDRDASIIGSQWRQDQGGNQHLQLTFWVGSNKVPHSLRRLIHPPSKWSIKRKLGLLSPVQSAVVWKLNVPQKPMC
jgi:hypothetical protein